MKFIYLLIVVTLALSTTANAGLIIDNGSYTSDTSSGLDWLDLSETQGFSYNYVLSQLNDNGIYKSWRYASLDEVDVLWQSFGLSKSDAFSPTSEKFSLFENILAHLGNTFESSFTNGFGFIGLTSNESYRRTDIRPKGQQYQRVQGMSYRPDFNIVSAPFNDADPRFGRITEGSYLVRKTSVPEPSTLAIFSLALLGLLVRKRNLLKAISKR